MMPSAFRRMIPSILCLAMLGACGSSPPVRYHALSRPAAAGSDASGAARVLVEILPVAVPDGVARPNLVMSEGNGRVAVLDSDRWLAPVADDMRQVVADSLWRSARAADTYQAPVPATAASLPRYRLAVRLERFDAIPGQAGVVVGSWTLRSLPDGAAHICRWAGTQPLDGKDATAAADALAEGSRRLADQIGDSLRRAVEGREEVCS
ncbi:MAG TPA: PqiC family protein [Magnetospirillum sp.]|jgi:uncharacterized lipoprotein YmbA|nr:PqiC family protein [Magnetospirillum sp.]